MGVRKITVTGDVIRHILSWGMESAVPMDVDLVTDLRALGDLKFLAVRLRPQEDQFDLVVSSAAFPGPDTPAVVWDRIESWTPTYRRIDAGRPDPAPPPFGAPPIRHR